MNHNACYTTYRKKLKRDKLVQSEKRSSQTFPTMLQRVLLHSETSTKMVAQLEKELTDKFRGEVDSAIIPRLVTAIYPLVPDNLDSEFSLKTLEDLADRCGLDLSVKGIKSRNPPGDKSWKDPQRQLYDETVATILVLKVFHLRNTCRFPNDETFLAEFPELEKAFALTSDYTDADIKRRKELDKIRTHKDLSTERLLCNVMDIIATLYKNAKKVFKTQCIYLVADVAGDCRGHLGRDPSPSTLRLILYFERVTGITKRPARPLKPLKPSVSDDHLSAGELIMKNDSKSSSSSSAAAGVGVKRKASSSLGRRARRKDMGLSSRTSSARTLPHSEHLLKPSQLPSHSQLQLPPAHPQQQQQPPQQMGPSHNSLAGQPLDRTKFAALPLKDRLMMGPVAVAISAQGHPGRTGGLASESISAGASQTGPGGHGDGDEDGDGDGDGDEDGDGEGEVTSLRDRLPGEVKAARGTGLGRGTLQRDQRSPTDQSQTPALTENHRSSIARKATGKRSRSRDCESPPNDTLTRGSEHSSSSYPQPSTELPSRMSGSCTDPYYLYGSIPLHPVYEHNLRRSSLMG